MEDHFKYITNNGITTEYKLSKSPFIAIILVLIWGLLYHRFYRGKKAILIFSLNKSTKIVKLTYLKSTRDCSYKDIKSLVNRLYSFAKENNAIYIETLVVNPCLHQKYLEREGWVFIKKKWIIGRVNHKYLNETQ